MDGLDLALNIQPPCELRQRHQDQAKLLQLLRNAPTAFQQSCVHGHPLDHWIGRGAPAESGREAGERARPGPRRRSGNIF